VSKWTPEPWFPGEMPVDPGEMGFDGTIQAAPSQEEQEAHDTDAGPYVIADALSEADALRICAAVNACADLTTAALESGVVTDLLDLAVRVLAYGIDGPRPLSRPQMADLVDRARAALAKAKGA
jgi:hypothetical protein